MTDRTFRLETRDERGLIIRIDVRTVSTFDEFMAAAAALGAEVLPRHDEGGHAAEPAHNLAAFRAAREWAAEHGHQQPDDRMLKAYGRVLLSSLGDSPRHIIDFRPDGWTIKHPLLCRLGDLFDCPVNRAVEQQVTAEPATGLGRYVCWLHEDDGLLVLGDRVDGPACCTSGPANDSTNVTAPTPPDHPHTDPGDGRTECDACGKWVWPAIHSCKGVPVTDRARARRQAEG